MGLSLAQTTGTSAVTVGLTIDYVRSAGPGQWLQIEPRVIRAGGKLGFVDALVTADGETIARASATFRVLT
jgi:acyl-coenzyme A thioesterase PaaI-like protein